jgi:cytochrome o ubiquinol oxidase subunit 2
MSSMTKRKKKLSQGKVAWLTLLGLAGLGLLLAILLRGTDVTLLNPKGLIAQKQTNLMLFSVAVMLSVAVPTLILFYFFAWRYRESSKKASYDPDTHHGKLFIIFLWAIPSVLVLTLAQAMWPAAHKLDPHKQIATGAAPLTIQVIAMRWKWLFIYPEQNIASVNFVQVPTGTPVQFELTADEAPMSSFWIPHLGGQLYAMTGHSNSLHLMADTPGDYGGRSAEINGPGFAGMKFMARASSKEAFERWVQGAQQSPNVLDSQAYETLLMPSENNPAAFYSSPQSDLYDKVLAKYSDSHHHTESE